MFGFFYERATRASLYQNKIYHFEIGLKCIKGDYNESYIIWELRTRDHGEVARRLVGCIPIIFHNNCTRLEYGHVASFFVSLFENHNLHW